MSIFLETTYPVDHTSVDEVNKSAPDYIAQHERLKKHYSSVTPSGKNGPTPQEKQAISDYTGSWSSPINHYLMDSSHRRQVREVSPDYARQLEERHKTMQRFMDSQAEAPEDIHAYSYISPKFNEALFHKTGSLFRSAAYISSSIHPWFNVRHSICFHIPAGSKVGAYVAGHSNFQDEHEFLINHGTKWKLTGKQSREVHSLIPGIGHTYHMEPAE